MRSCQWVLLQLRLPNRYLRTSIALPTSSPTVKRNLVLVVKMGSLGKPQFFNIINNEKRGGAEVHQVTNPRTEEPLWDCPIASTQDLEDAIAAANKAFPAWSRTTVAERQALLVKMADVIQQNAAELIEILMQETGKSVSSSLCPSPARLPCSSQTNTLLDPPGPDRNQQHSPTSPLLL